MLKFLYGNWNFQLMDKAGGDGAGGGGGTGGGNADGNKGGGNADLASQLAEATKRADALDARIKAIEAKATKGTEGGNGKNDDDEDLNEKSRKEREAKEKGQGDEKKLEAALNFNIRSKDWIKDNAALLPKSIEGIFEQAAKENYANAIEKDGAIKAGIVKEFFSLQENLELLTPTLKTTLEDFLKLTKNVRQERAQSIYDTVFEPAFEMLKRVKKAQELNKGVANETDGEAAYKNKMIGLSRKHYLGEKQNGA